MTSLERHHIRSIEEECRELREENSRLRDALEPFAKVADQYDGTLPGIPRVPSRDILWGDDGLTVGDLRKARAALQGAHS